MKLNEIRDNPGAVKERHAGPVAASGSGKGKTGGRGVKGEKSRSGVSIRRSKAARLPIYRGVPKRASTFLAHGIFSTR